MAITQGLVMVIQWLVMMAGQLLAVAGHLVKNYTPTINAFCINVQVKITSGST